jgi:gliding motility-associated-like protein
MNKTILQVLNSLKRSVWVPLSILMLLSIENTVAQCNPKQDSLVLVQLYDSTNGNQWLNTLRDTAKWKVKGVPIGKWYGVSVNTEGCVTYLSLGSDSLKGVLPASLTTLSALNWISLSYNRLSGQIPNFNSPNLERIWLYGNQLSGSIPNFNLPNLKDLWLSDNQLNGQIPNFNLPNLERLDLDDNRLSGVIPNFTLKNLITLRLSDNALRGSIPNFDVVNLPKLLELYLTNDSLSGSIPKFNLPKLKKLDLSSNKLTGLIPNFDLPELQWLLLADNQLSGLIPKIYLPSLTRLSLRFNNLSGCIPREIKANCPLIGSNGADIYRNAGLTTDSWYEYWEKFKGACPPTDTTTCRYRDSIQLVALYNSTDGLNWKNKWTLRESLILPNGLPNTTYWYGIMKFDTEGCITEIKLDNNNLRGVLPDLKFSKLRALSLQFNQLSGTLPDFNLPSLTKLELSSNQFDSIIPNFSGMPNLIELDLDDNKLKDAIPNFNKLKNLLFLDLTMNSLTGRIPNFNNLPKLQSLYLRNNKLNGIIPDFQLPDLTTLWLHNNGLTGPLPDLNILTKLTNIQMQDNKLTGCFPISYLRFCRSISDPEKRKFNENIGLGLANSRGDFQIFCDTPYDTLRRKVAIYTGDSVRLDSVRVVYPKLTTTYTDTVVLPSPDCRIRLKITEVIVQQRDTLSTTIKVAVTPDGDGVNDQLDLQDFVNWSLYRNNELIIYNRWGQKVYAASPYNRDWSGQTTDGTPLFDGNYLFVLRLELDGRIIKGSIFLKR